jgi:TolA-binding protein/predicted  nucleic acid-binding Zn-ribbon protein
MIRLPSRRFTSRIACVALMFALALVGRAAEPFELDLRLLEELNKRELFDYSAAQVEQMLARYPKERDQILIAKAKMLFAARKSAEAESIVGEIPATSPQYPEAMLLLGEANCRRGKFEDAVKAYAKFFRAGEVEKRLPKGTDEDAVAEFRRHVTMYKVALEKTGDIKEAQRVIGLLGEIKGTGDDRGTKFLQLRTVLDAEEAKLDQRKDVDLNAVKKALDGFSQLIFQRDGVGALSYVETARAHVILGGAKLNAVLLDPELSKPEKAAEKGKKLAEIREFVEAVGILKSAGELLEDLANAQGGEGELLGGALFYQGKAYRGQAVLMHYRGQDAKSEKLLNVAAKCFETVASDFGESRFQSLALAEHAKCSRMSKTVFEEEIELAEDNTDAQLKLKVEQAKVFLQKQEYAKAIPPYLEAARIGRASKKLPTVVSPLVVSMGHEGYFIEAEALASYLVDVLPKDEMTARCVLQLGASLKAAAKDETDAERKADLEARAATVWEMFVEIAPLDNYAPMVAYAIADQHYSRAIELARLASEETDRAKQEALKAQAREIMASSIPEFKRVVEQYGTSTYAGPALYNLAWCYYEADQRKEAADAFLRYAEDDELDPKYASQRLQAKFRGAECMMLGGQPEDAVAQFKELVAWASPGNDQGFDAKTETAARLRDVARMDIGYSYDQAAELLRPQMSELQERLRAAQKVSSQCAEDIKELQDALAALDKQSEDAKAQYSVQEKDYLGFKLDFADAAREQALQEQTEDPDKMAPDVREKALEQQRQRIAQLRTEMERQAKVNAEGELATLVKTQEEAEAERAVLTADVKTLLEDIGSLRTKLPAPKAAAEPTGDGLATLNALAAILAEGRATLVSNLEAARKQLADKEAAKAEASRTVARLETEKQAADEQFSTLRDDVVATTDNQQKARLVKARDEAEAKLQALTADLTEWHQKLAALDEQTKEAEKAVATAKAAKDELWATAGKLREDAQLAVRRDQVLNERVSATAAAIPFVQRLGEVLSLPVDERKAHRKELEELGGKAVKAYAALRDATIELLVTRRTHVTDAIALKKDQVAAAAEAVARSQENLAPIREAFEGWKRKAIAAFQEYLTNPEASSANLASVLAKLGTTYIELEDFAKAEEVLSRLATEHPDSDAGKGALFNLARSQSETGKNAEAAATFERLLAEPDGIALANLQYIGREMLDAGQPAIALKACAEVVARSEKESGPDYEEAKRVREGALFRAGRAALDLGKFDLALQYLDTLLKENPKSGFFYDIKFATASARAALVPPDIEGAVRDLNEVAFTTDPVLKNRADCQLGTMWAGTKDAATVTKGASRLRMVADLADPANPENLPWIEQALFEAAKAYARLGRADDRQAMVKAYRERFPKGKYLDQLSNLPAAEFGN